MNAIFRSRLGISAAAKRVDQAALAFQRHREGEAEWRRHPVCLPEATPVAPLDHELKTPRQWAEEQIASWAERQPHIVVAFKPRWRAITEEVAALYGVAVEDLTGPRRTADLIEPRFEAMYRIADETPLSLPEIGRRFNRDHTTVLQAIRKHAARNGLPLPRQDEGDAS